MLTLARQLREGDLRYGIAAACVGDGQGMALLIEKPAYQRGNGSCRGRIGKEGLKIPAGTNGSLLQTPISSVDNRSGVRPDAFTQCLHQGFQLIRSGVERWREDGLVSRPAQVVTCFVECFRDAVPANPRLSG